MTSIAKKDLHQTVTDRIIAQLENGTAPWAPRWNAGVAPIRPLRSTGQPYNGVNVLTLWIDAQEKGFTSPYWFGFQAASKMGAHVRKGEHGSQVVYANKIIKTEQKPDTGEESIKAIPFLKQSYVFNAQQIEGLPEHFYQANQPVVNQNERDARIESFIAGLHADIRHGGNQAYYQITNDFIKMPELSTFDATESYYATLFHELTHWTRHKSRLDRDMGRKTWGDAGYAMEELVAEMGAAFICADLGLHAEPRQDHASYIASWLEVLKNDKRAIFTASSKASQATEYLHDVAMPRELAA